MRKQLFSFAIVVLLAAGCAERLEAPTDRGVCYALSFDKEGQAKFNPVARDMPNFENCAAQLEGMRLRFSRMGLRKDYVEGAYQGTFIFIRPEGVFTSRHYDGPQFPALVRTGDGRLAVPGVMPPE